MPRQRNPWKHPHNLSVQERMGLSKFLMAFEAGYSARKSCQAAFGREETWRKNIFELFQAARVLNLLEVKAPTEHRLAEQLILKYGLEAACVISVDTTSVEGRSLFGSQCACVFVDQLRHLCEQGGEVDIALGGGESVNYMLDKLEKALTTHSWLSRMRRRIHLWSPTVGHLTDRWIYASLVHVYRCGQILDLPVSSCHPLFGHAFTGEEELDRYRCKPDVQDAIQASQRMTMIVTSCGAGEYSYCIGAMREAGPIPEGVVGECLFNLLDSDGCVIPCRAPVFTLYPGQSLPEKVAACRHEKGGFISLAFVYGGTAEATVAKARALHAAIRHNERAWFNHVVCTESVARELLNL